MSTLDVVVGAQFGSEAKGHCVQRLTERRLRESGHAEVIRVAGPNAGHTGYDVTGRRWALRQLPVAAVVPGRVTLGISAGSEIDPEVLLRELDDARELGLLEDKNVWVSSEATVITDMHKQTEADLHLTTRLGSTAKGIGAARADRAMRSASRLADQPELMRELTKRGVIVRATETTERGPVGTDSPLIIEGTQGYGLGLHAGYYPQCTSSDCRAIDFMAMAGVSPWEWEEPTIWLVARVFPIRVAGNSGELKGETTWTDMRLPDEHTTVTQKVRRVGEPDWDLVHAAAVANGASHVKLVVTMVDQKDPLVKGVTDWAHLTPIVIELLHDVETKVGAKIGLVTTSPNTGIWVQ